MAADRRHATTTDGVWRVMRFETADGKWAEVASNKIGPEAVPVPDGYRFVRSTPMVPRADMDALTEEIEAAERAISLIAANLNDGMSARGGAGRLVLVCAGLRRVLRRSFRQP